MKQNIKKRMKLIFIQASCIMLLAGVLFAFSFVLLSKQDNNLTNDASYVFEEQPIKVNTDTIKQMNLTKFLRLDGQTTRANNVVQSIMLGNDEPLNCIVGSIINSATDISDNNDQTNFSKGRVVNIVNNGANTTISIDLASNYLARFELSDAYHRILQDIISGNLAMTIQNNNSYLDFIFSALNYDVISCNYILTYQLLSIDEYTYSGMMIRAKIKESEYQGAIYIEPRIIKNITTDYHVVLDRVKSIDNDKLITEQIEVQIIDVVDNKIIIDGYSYLGDSFIIYDKYHGVPTI
ncbi:MAG: hypothetical protein LBF68_08395 [Christensenellaceae bacterium]|jgi:hypothetical protein|nr:hypothetical protein [Christensenellaceae bacterium]